MRFNKDTIAKYANFLFGVFFAIFSLITIMTPGAALFLGLLSALFFYNFTTFRRLNYLFSEEEYLKSEIRKMELRGKLSDLGHPDFRMPPTDDN